MQPIIAALLAIVALVAARGAPRARVPLTLLQAPAARCLDGTQSGYYHQPASSDEGANKWVFHLQGGGECATKAACYAALQSALGSSKVCASVLGAWWVLFRAHMGCVVSTLRPTRSWTRFC